MSNVSLFNSNAYNAALYYGSRVLSLGQIGLGHDPRLAHLITHDPYCPCGVQGLVQRNFKKSAALFGAVTLPLTYWKWRKSEFVVVGFFVLAFMVVMQEISKRSNELAVQRRLQDILSETIYCEVLERPVTHMGYLNSEQGGHEGVANCGQTFEESKWLESMKEHTGCLGCNTQIPSSKAVYNLAAWGFLNLAVSLGQWAGKGHLQQHRDRYYPFDYLEEDESSPVVWRDGHTYSRKELVEVLALGEPEQQELPVNKWLKDFFKEIAKPSAQ